MSLSKDVSFSFKKALKEGYESTSCMLVAEQNLFTWRLIFLCFLGGFFCSAKKRSSNYKNSSTSHCY